MCRLMFLLVLLLCVCVYADACKKGWTKGNSGSCYFITDVKELWNDGLDHCIRLGGTLATVTSKDENEFIKDMVKRKGDNAWIGGMNVGNDNKTWRWASTLKRLTFTDWNSGQPDNGNQNCLGLNKPSSYKWHDYICTTDKHYSVCEIDKQEIKEKGCCCTANHLLQELMECRKI